MSTKILLVDDNEDLLKISQLILNAQGHEVMVATSLEEAEQQINLHQPLLMLLDVHVCEEDGLLYCHQLKQNAVTRGMRIILMSGSEYPKEEWNGADDFLCKPFDFTTLIGKVEKQLTEIQPVSADNLQ